MRLFDVQITLICFACLFGNIPAVYYEYSFSNIKLGVLIQVLPRIFNKVVLLSTEILNYFSNRIK